MTHDELAELLGAYALDAVSPEEASEIEEHLLECPRCRAEVAAHLEVAGVLGNLSGSVPAGVWESIAEELAIGSAGPLQAPARPIGRSLADITSEGDGAADEQTIAPVIALDGARRLRDARKGSSSSRRSDRSRRTRTVILTSGLVAASLALVVGVLSAKVVDLDHQVAALSVATIQGGVSGQLAAAKADPNHQTITLASAVSGKPWAAELVVAEGRAFLVPENMPSLAGNETYQAWAIEGNRYVSLGVLGQAPVELQLQPQMSSLALNVEPEGGVAQPTSLVLVQGKLPSTL